MNLILWRHAEAEEAAPHGDDLARALTGRGEKQAKRMAAWLDRHLPDGVRIVCSPARRAEQTADALQRKFKLRDELAPNGTVAQLLDLVQWPDAKPTFLVVGHQPVLGQTVAQLLGLRGGECSIRKGAIWWLRHREKNREGDMQTTVITVQTPELL